MKDRLASLESWHERLVRGTYRDEDLIDFVRSEIVALRTRRAVQVANTTASAERDVERPARAAGDLFSFGGDSAHTVGALAQ
jgi:hypothetical protein